MSSIEAKKLRIIHFSITWGSHISMVFLLCVSIHCGHQWKFTPLDSQPAELRSLDSLEAVPPFTATGSVFAIREDIRYRARWAFATDSGTLRIQAFQQDGSMFADITTGNDSVCVLVPSSRECHCGPLKLVPLADLLGVEIDWNAACNGLWRVLYPIRNAPNSWIPGRIDGRTGWMNSSLDLFIAPDEKWNLAAFLSVGDKDDRIIVEVEAFETIDQYTLPSKIVISWQKEDTKLWIDIERISVDTSGIPVRGPCPPGAIPILW